MKRGSRALSPSAVRRSLMAVFSTDSVTNWWPQTASSSASFVNRAPGWRASAHSRLKGVGASATALPPRSSQAFASSSSKSSNRRRTGSEVESGRGTRYVVR